MRIALYKHNEDAYRNAVAMLDECKKAAIIHPTGTGKSFIAFKLCEDNPQKSICWLSPSEYIFNTQVENLKKVTSGYSPSNISFFTYAKLMNMSEGEIAEIKPAIVILDEFHRCGAEMWGKGVERLLSIYKDVPILGLSATSIRYLDNQRNMADELFDGNIASEMTLGDAIVRGILSPPKYVLSSFSCKEELKKYKTRINRAKNKAVRDQAERYLEALCRALDKADGLEEVFDKHMTDRAGKYIVFCANYEHLCQMRELAAEWFCKIDNNPHIYSLYTEDASTDREFQAFKADNDDKHLKLLYCIDALNEGVHLDGISGVILLRPTVSPIIYKQQIGRALQTGIKQSSVIFDIVLNIENLCSIGSIENEMRIAISYYRSRGLEYEVVNEHFRIIDEVKDCINLFEKLNESLTASWDYMYLEAKKYYKNNGNLNVPKRYKTEEGYSLGSWIATQRRIFCGSINGMLTKERIEKLTDIGMIWENQRDAKWEVYFGAAKEYYQKNGNLSVLAKFVTEDGVKLGSWISNLRTLRKSGSNSSYLTFDRIGELDKIGMIWDVSDYLWQEYYEACENYFKVNKNLDIPCKYVDDNGLKLGSWISQIRTAYNNKEKSKYKLTDEQIDKMDKLGMIWNKKSDVAWEKGCSELKKYFKAHKSFDIPVSYTTAEGYRLGKWLERQRNNPNLAEKKKKQLKSIGALRKPTEDAWEARFNLAKEYFDENGNLDIPQSYKTKEGFLLAEWVNGQRDKRRRGKLDTDKINRLNKIGIDWLSPTARRWENYFLACKRYYLEYGNLEIPTTYVDAEGNRIGRWIAKIKKSKSKLKTSGENDNQIERLESIGIKWQDKAVEPDKITDEPYKKVRQKKFLKTERYNEYVPN